MDRIDKRAAISLAVSFVISLLTAYVTEMGLALSVVLPTVCFLQTRRSLAFLSSFGYAVFWSGRRSSTLWRAPLAVLASVPPPLGIIGWANPLTAAGVLFPGSGWLGIVLILAFAAVSPINPRTSFVLVLVLVVTANAVYPGTPAPPADWEAINTTFGGTGLESSSPIIEFRAAQTIQQRSLRSRAKVILFRRRLCRGGAWRPISSGNQR